MDQPTLHVIGMDTDGRRPLSEAARAAIDGAVLIIGEPRHLAALPSHRAETRPYPRPFSDLDRLLRRQAGQTVVLLASGDPLLFGVGGYLTRTLSLERVTFHPAVSSLQTAFARAGLPWQEAELVSLHGRPLRQLRGRLRRNRLYGLLTDADSHPAAVADELVAHGLGASTVWIAEALGLPDERLRTFTAEQLVRQRPEVDPLNVVLLRTRTAGEARLPEFPGIPDEHFATDRPGGGLITKREVRLTALSLLQPAAGETGWDVGAGCGALAVEWARWNRLGQVHALERDPARLALLAENNARFGTEANLTAITGRAPGDLDALPDPATVFVGGGGADLPAILQACWDRLSPGGRLVAVAVTEASRAALHRFAGDTGEWTQLAVARGERLAGELVLRPRLPVVLLRRSKPVEPAT
jgi:precorrin-6Y C5,15-methyltransferase (decarboxylating)